MFRASHLTKTTPTLTSKTSDSKVNVSDEEDDTEGVVLGIKSSTSKRQKTDKGEKVEKEELKEGCFYSAMEPKDLEKTKQYMSKVSKFMRDDVKLTDAQLAFVEWAIENIQRGDKKLVDGDDMGFGKSISAIVLMMYIYLEMDPGLHDRISAQLSENVNHIQDEAQKLKALKSLHKQYKYVRPKGIKPMIIVVQDEAQATGHWIEEFKKFMALPSGFVGLVKTYTRSKQEIRYFMDNCAIILTYSSAMVTHYSHCVKLVQSPKPTVDEKTGTRKLVFKTSSTVLNTAVVQNTSTKQPVVVDSEDSSSDDDDTGGPSLDLQILNNKQFNTFLCELDQRNMPNDTIFRYVVDPKTKKMTSFYSAVFFDEVDKLTSDELNPIMSLNSNKVTNNAAIQLAHLAEYIAAFSGTIILGNKPSGKIMTIFDLVEAYDTYIKYAKYNPNVTKLQNCGVERTWNLLAPRIVIRRMTANLFKDGNTPELKVHDISVSVTTKEHAILKEYEETVAKEINKDITRIKENAAARAAGIVLAQPQETNAEGERVTKGGMMNILKQLMVLRQISALNPEAAMLLRDYGESLGPSHPDYNRKIRDKTHELNGEIGPSSKETALIELWKLKCVTQGEKGIQFYSYLYEYMRLKHLFEKNGIKVFQLDAEQSSEERNRSLREFRDYKGGAVMIASIRIVSRSFSMPFANNIGFTAAAFNPAVMAQACARVNRVNQMHKTINVFYVIYGNSVDQWVQDKILAKKNLESMCFGEKVVAGRTKDTLLFGKKTAANMLNVFRKFSEDIKLMGSLRVPKESFDPKAMLEMAGPKSELLQRSAVYQGDDDINDAPEDDTLVLDDFDLGVDVGVDLDVDLETVETEVGGNLVEVAEKPDFEMTDGNYVGAAETQTDDSENRSKRARVDDMDLVELDVDLNVKSDITDEPMDVEISVCDESNSSGEETEHESESPSKEEEE